MKLEKRRTIVWIEDKSGKKLAYLTPLFYCSDRASSRVLIVEIDTVETNIQAERHEKVPLHIPDKFNGEETEVHTVKEKQDFRCFWRTVKSCQLKTNFDTYRFFIKYKPHEPSYFEQFCKWLEELRKKNSGLYDISIKCASYIWEAIVVAVTYFTGSALITSLTACISYAIFIVILIASERNRAERLKKETEEECDSKIAEYKKKIDKVCDHAQDEKRKLEEGYKKAIADSLLKLVTTEHAAAHSGKLCTVDMASLKTIVDSSLKLIEFLKKCVNDLEKQLSDYYKFDVCASFKLFDINNDSEPVLRTCARGNNNIRLRELIGEASSFEAPVKVSSNTAYTHIIKKQQNCFYNGDLREYDKKKKRKKFKCEYKNWQKYFVSTIIIPIRWHVSNKESYKIAALICVDCKEPLRDWDNRNSFGYQLVAFYADLLYTPLRDYEEYRNRSHEKEEN